ncbi:hypothetical protein [Anabaena sp. UHCC 0451]|uniref:hypothetical protein n=1 Tax=Anabaena sp. UHCC 0451 TaxID=2055235 RepID=UPI002B2212FB|nr:hypothetical protein [Anabaena sp. UHCC 0451]MEA5575925.1 hypothetical protein [Anabaena sp. UHCC 0451]
MKINWKQMLISTENYLKAATLVSEINDIKAEKICGGMMTAPQTIEENSPSTIPATGSQRNISSPRAYNELGLTPFFPDLPATKLPRLGQLDPNNRTVSPRKNQITITIPLPSPIYN